MPKIIIFAGANGSGKTTLAGTVLGKQDIFINADKIREDENLSFIDASKKAIELLDKNIASGKDISFETTMSGRVLNRKFKQMASKKYKIIIFYLFAYPVELLVERVKERVKKGGHPVGTRDIVRRYYRSAANFWKKYRFFADEWTLVLNNEVHYKNVAAGDKKDFYVVNDPEFEVFKEVVANAGKNEK